ncbi:hypothetical protein C8F04DRAFT_1187981 [Mycena alexandri]|uniref:Uncharacterized protein n=1 Tax=Mycena alexandri TaxID=1745969 RepID=A0AAD6WZA6_9AGAR|nr:hypothetical protein C8F04DRAFT_1187981 [Mycena alexandri]
MQMPNSELGRLADINTNFPWAIRSLDRGEEDQFCAAVFKVYRGSQPLPDSRRRTPSCKEVTDDTQSPLRCFGVGVARIEKWRTPWRIRDQRDGRSRTHEGNSNAERWVRGIVNGARVRRGGGQFGRCDEPGAENAKGGVSTLRVYGGDLRRHPGTQLARREGDRTTPVKSKHDKGGGRGAVTKTALAGLEMSELLWWLGRRGGKRQERTDVAVFDRGSLGSPACRLSSDAFPCAKPSTVETSLGAFAWGIGTPQFVINVNVLWINHSGRVLGLTLTPKPAHADPTHVKLRNLVSLFDTRCRLQLDEKIPPANFLPSFQRAESNDIALIEIIQIRNGVRATRYERRMYTVCNRLWPEILAIPSKRRVIRFPAQSEPAIATSLRYT